MVQHVSIKVSNHNHSPLTNSRYSKEEIESNLCTPTNFSYVLVVK